MVTVRPLLSAADARLFARVPDSVYGENARRPRDIRHLLRASDYASQGRVIHYLAEADNHVVGRISAHVHPERGGAFGLFDCREDFDTARALLSTAEDWLRAEGMTNAVGPLDPSAVVSGGIFGTINTPNSEQMPATSPWHAAMLKTLHWSTLETFQTWTFSEPVPKQVRQISNAVQQTPGLRVVSMAELLTGRGAWTEGQLLQTLTDLYNDTYDRTFKFVTTSAKDLGAFLGFPDRLEPHTTLIAIKDDQPIAFAVALAERTAPTNQTQWSLSQTVQRLIAERLRRPTTIRLALFGILPEFRGSALGGLSLHMYVQLVHAMRSRGIDHGVLTWTRANDEITAAGLSLIGAKPLHTYQLFQKDLR